MPNSSHRAGALPTAVALGRDTWRRLWSLLRCQRQAVPRPLSATIPLSHGRSASRRAVPHVGDGAVRPPNCCWIVHCEGGGSPSLVAPRARTRLVHRHRQTVQVVVCWRRLPRAPHGALVQRRLHQRRRALCPKRPPWHLRGRTDVWVVHLRPHQPRRRVNRIGGWCVYVHVRGWWHRHHVGRRLWEAAASRGNPRTRGNGPSSDAVAPHTSTGTQTSKQSPLQGKMVHHY